MRPRAFLAFALVAIAALFCGISVTNHQLLGGLRWDVTQDRLFTLSEGTQRVLDGLEDTITLDFYAAKDALAQDPQSRLYASRVRDMLEAYVARAHGRITLIDHNPAPFSPAEDAAIAAGITAIAGASPDDPVLYLGLTVRSSTGQVAQLPLLSPQREASLEYDISRALAQVTQVRRPRLAVLTSLPWLFARDPNQGAITPIAHVAHELARTFDIQLLDDDFAEIPPQTDVLLIAQPDTLSEAQLYALDQFALTQGRVMVFLDPASSVAKDGGGGGALMASQALGPLAQAWGFSVQSDVVLDRANALPVQTQINGRAMVAPQPLFFTIPKAGLNADSILTTGFERGVNLGTPGEVAAKSVTGLTFTPLLTTSPDTMLLDARRALSGLSPEAVAADWEGAGTAFVVAALIRGELRTAFPKGPPASAAAPVQTRAHRNLGARAAQILVVGDVDALADSLYLSEQGEVADNAAFVLNAADLLSGTQSLIGLRARSPIARPLVVVERLKAQAQARVLDEQQQLQNQLNVASARLNELEAKDTAKGLFTGQTGTGLSRVEQAELTRFRNEVQEARKRLRAVQDGVRRAIGSIKWMLILLSGFLVPILIALSSADLFIAGRMRARKA
ncbi:MAG: hypothetical protein RL186_1259, partial [Pseudomonadota bacterium]